MADQHPIVKAQLERARMTNIGKSLEEIPCPAIVLDRAIVARNCRQMLDMVDKVGVAFRGHVKTHKTVEATELMMGGPTSTRDVNLIASTEREIRHLEPWLKAQQAKTRRVNILLGVPLAPSRIPSLLSFSNNLGPSSLTVMIDHPAQLDALTKVYLKPRAFIKIDTGAHRAGVPSSSESKVLRELLRKMKEVQEAGNVVFHGFYSYPDSYWVSEFGEALGVLRQELRGVGEVVKIAREEGLGPVEGEKGFVLSVGATPTTSVAWMNADPKAQDGEVPELIRKMQEQGHVVEFHAGNYPILDIQQIATAAGVTSTSTVVPTASHCPPRLVSDLALTILAEVNSSHTHGERAFPEQLITAGCLALGREPCKSYPGWGVVSEWPHGTPGTHGGIQKGSGWYVHAISQEHGKIRKGDVPGVPVAEKEVERQVGDKVRVWPNHACIAVANFPYFHVVDGEDESRGEKVVDLWARCVGW